ncbi:Protein of unknown function [Bacillus thuringiensis]|uniref:Uncharacterized protein n=1 Tax=Bacillus thuringiensis TaxID=1428 RepID=A0A1C4DV25_BACTU|nr:Protein of unknown function [Bacillus thuringiensis]SCN34388.1 Protein of unknown function [Bacillus wiedmannii]
MGEGVVLEGKSEHGIEFIRRIIKGGVMEMKMKIIQLIIKLEHKEVIIVF